MRIFIIACLLMAASLFPAALGTAVAIWLPEHLTHVVAERCVLTVYLKEKPGNAAVLNAKVTGIPGTRTVRLLSPAEGYHNFSVWLGNDAGPILAGVRPDALPTTMQISLADERIADVNAYLLQLKTAVPSVDEVRYPARELAESLNSIERIADICEYLRYLLLAVGIVGSLCVGAVIPNVETNYLRQVLNISAIGLSGGTIAELLLIGSCQGMSIIGWQMSIPTTVHFLTLGLGVLLGVLAGCARIAQSWWEQRSIVVCEDLVVNAEAARQEPVS